ncbi:MAG: hypothetical protein AAFR21_11550 [Pseudomonadota bacterium]
MVREWNIELESPKVRRALSPIRKIFRKFFIADIEASYSVWLSRYGDASYRIYRDDDHSQEADLYRRFRSFLRFEKGCGSFGERMILNRESLTKSAVSFADAQYDGFLERIVQRFGDINLTAARFYGGNEFDIDADVGGRAVTLFHRIECERSGFEAPVFHLHSRIYVDGKFTPLAKFKEAVA